MSNPDTQKLIARVEEKTGYRVTVDTASGIYEHAQMLSAQPESPAHLIRVNDKHLHHADYIVAVQCWILLILWSDPQQVPAMAANHSECRTLVDRWVKAKQLSQYPPDTAAQTSKFCVESLLNQLNSMPLEIRVANLCFEFCPRLREMQIESFNAHLRRISEVFSAKIKDQTPSEAFEKNVAMNAALALNWARISGSRICLLPYESTGNIEAGKRLLDTLDEIAGQTSECHVRTVDAWAEQLSLRSLYIWQLTNRSQ